MAISCSMAVLPILKLLQALFKKTLSHSARNYNHGCYSESVFPRCITSLLQICATFLKIEIIAEKTCIIIK